MNQLFKNTVIVSFYAFLLAACGEKEAPKDDLPSYPVVEVESRDVRAFQTYPASIQGMNNNDVRAKIQGYVSEVLVDEGERVRKGQVMFRLETNTLSQDAIAAQSSISAARARADAALVEVNKLRPLVEQNIVSSVLLETARANLLLAESELEQAKASHKSIAANVDYSAIRAPMDGVVGKINFREGALVGPSDQTPMTMVSDIKEMYAYFSMNEAEYLDFLDETEGNSLEEKLKNVPMVELLMPNGRTYGEKGRISAVTGQIDPQTGSAQFRASFPNKNRLLANGNSGTVRIPKTHENATVIPEAAVFEQQGKLYAGKVLNGTVEIVEVQIAGHIDKLVLVESGLRPGDTIVASGVARLRTNTAIQVEN